MKIKNIFLCINLFLIIFAFTINVNSQPSVTLRLIYPPPNTLTPASLWRISLTNNTNEPLSIYLEGYVDESSAGRIVEGSTNIFSLPPGTSNYSYSNFSSGTVTWRNKKYKDFILRKQTVPAGQYSICVTALPGNSQIVHTQACINQIINRTYESEINLISPAEEDSISPSGMLNFAWNPGKKSAGDSYTLKIVEMTANQSPEQAIKQNRNFFTKTGIETSNFIYPSSAPKFLEGKKYAWRIFNSSIESTVMTFYIKVLEEKN